MALPKPLSGVLASSAQACQPLPRGEPRSQESCSGAGRAAPEPHLSRACSGPRDRTAWPSVFLEREASSWLQALALGGVNKKGVVL